MEHNELDDIFRKQIQTNDSDLNENELQSKQNIWEALDKPQRASFFHFWKIAAAVLLLLLGCSTWFFSKKINQQQAKILEVENNYNKVFTSFEKLKKQSSTPPDISKETLPDLISNKVTSVELTSSSKNFTERLVYISDTVWLEKERVAPIKMQLVRDTIFIEVPTPPMANSELPIEATNQPSIEKKIPSKVEFVFGKKPLKKPAQENNSIFLKTEVAKKPKSKNRGLIILPIKN